ncbi:arsenate reductase family protein [Azotosporobacter soli]|uniref:arsenate reductase family protein n=1 Tax=Azotosporobacter soli TaxID=3055040 RepID=UPI0031FE6C64
MADKALFLWYPKCTTCQKTKSWLDEHAVLYEARDIKEQPPSAAELKTWHERSGLPLRKFFNTSGLVYKARGLKDKLATLSDAQQIELLASDGMLVKRPLLVTAKAVLVGFKEAEWAAKV